jgi:hypothetical protein
MAAKLEIRHVNVKRSRQLMKQFSGVIAVNAKILQQTCFRRQATDLQACLLTNQLHDQLPAIIIVHRGSGGYFFAGLFFFS